MAHVVVHPTCQPQLSHGSVDKRVASSPPLPGLQVASVGTPSQSLRAWVDKYYSVIHVVLYRIIYKNCRSQISFTSYLFHLCLWDIKIFLRKSFFNHFLPYMEVWGTPRAGQETTSAASKPDPSMPVCVGTLGVCSVPPWRPTKASVGSVVQSGGMETGSWYLGRLPCLTLYRIYTHLGHMGETAEHS